MHTIRRLFGQGATRLSVVAVCFCLFLGSAPAWAESYYFSSHNNQAMTSLHLGGVMTDDFEPLAENLMQIVRQEHEDPMQMLEDVIMAENWESWRIFQITPGMAVPLAAAEMYIVYGGQSGKRTRLKLGQSGPKAPSVRVEMGKDNVYVNIRGLGTSRGDSTSRDIPTLDESPFQQGKATLEKRVYELRDPFRPEEQKYSVLNVISDSTGIFSSQPWTLENILPRLLLVGVLMAAVLFGVEFLRNIVMLGLRSLGRKGGGGR